MAKRTTEKKADELENGSTAAAAGADTTNASATGDASTVAKRGAEKFTVLDSNGKVFRVVDSLEEANELVKLTSGRLQR